MSSKDNLELFSKNTENNPDQETDYAFSSRTSQSLLSSTLNHASSSSNTESKLNFSLKNLLQDPPSSNSIYSKNEKNNSKNDEESLVIKPIPIRLASRQQTSNNFTQPQHHTESIRDLFANHSVLKPNHLDFPSANSNFSTALPQPNEYVPTTVHAPKYHPYARASYPTHSTAYIPSRDGSDNSSTSPPYQVPAFLSNPPIPRVGYPQGGIQSHPIYTSNQHSVLQQSSSDQQNDEQESKVPQKKYIFKDYSSNDQISPPLFSMKQMQQIPPPPISPYFQHSHQNTESLLLPPASSIDANIYINPSDFSRLAQEDENLPSIGNRFMTSTANFPHQHPMPLPPSSSSSSASSNKTTGDSDSGSSQQGPAFGEWTPEEHDAFLRGYHMFGHGKWKEISDSFVPSRTRIQVASHAQKWIRSQRRKQERISKQQQRHQENGSSGDSGLS